MFDNLISRLVESVSSVILFVGVLFGGASTDTVEQNVATTTTPVIVEEVVSTSTKYEESNYRVEEYKEVVLTKEEQLRNLRDNLRNANIVGTRRSEPMRFCDNSIGDVVEEGGEKIVKAQVDGGLTFTFNLADMTKDYDALEIYATDSEGGVAGHSPYPGNEGRTLFNSSSDNWQTSRYGYLNLLSLENYIDGDIRIRNVGSEGHFFSFYISDWLGNCDITSQIMFGMGTSTTVTIPLSKAGDLGPMEWDFESDGVVDMYESLLFKPSEEQVRLQQDIYMLTHPVEMGEWCKKLSVRDFTKEDQHLYEDLIIIKKWCLEKSW